MTIPLPTLPSSAHYDVVVLGAGGAGLAAALFAAVEGQRVLLVERTDRVGGTTALSGGTIWIPNTSHAAAAGAQDSPENAARYLREVIRGESPDALRQAFLQNGPRALDAIERHSALRFMVRPHYPDYFSEREGATLFGRALGARTFDGRQLGPLFGLIRPPMPELTVLGGMMVDRDDIRHLLAATRSPASLRHALALVARYAADRLRHPRGTRLVLGNALVAGLLHALARQPLVDLILNARTTALQREGDAVTGVQLRHAGQEVQVRAGRGVILSSGGFNRHPELRRRLLRQPVAEHSATAPGTTGELHDLALAIGARHGEGNEDSAFWAPVSLRKRPDGTVAVFPHLLLDRGKPGIFAVDRSGRRFVNEADSYHLFVQGMYAASAASPAIPAFLIADARALAQYGLGLVPPRAWRLRRFLRDGYLVRADTLEGLAAQLGIDAEGLARTAAAVNGYARLGIDAEFGRGGSAYNHFMGDPGHRPHPNLGPIDTPPFYALRLYPGDIGAATGLVTDADARVLDGGGHPIPGLYACGNDMNSVMAGTYTGPGITLGPALTFAYLAARHASAQGRTEGGVACQRKECIVHYQPSAH